LLGRLRSPQALLALVLLLSGIAILRIVMLTVSGQIGSTTVSRVEGSSPRPSDPASGAQAEAVAWYAWITAASTGLGALPFLFVAPAAYAALPTQPQAAGGAEQGGRKAPVASHWLGACNAVASGMMLAASASLALEGATHDSHATAAQTPSLSATPWSGLSGVAAGFLVGVCFILVSKRVLDGYEDDSLDLLLRGGAQGGDGAMAEEGAKEEETTAVAAEEAGVADVALHPLRGRHSRLRRMLLIVGVMTLHSLSEGVGLGVSFGTGEHGFGTFISATLAVHNVPEGLATCLVLVPGGVPLAKAALWAVGTSLPQVLMALPAFYSVQLFAALLPLGLGFAAGAMTWVAVFELFAEARDELGFRRTAVIAVGAAAGMAFLQATLRGD
jgi:zinc transporter ZupT